MATPRMGTPVVLLAPEALGGNMAEIATVHATAAGRARALVCIAKQEHIAFAVYAVRLFGADTQWLVGPDVATVADAPPVVARMPDGTEPNQQIDFALAMSDVVIAVGAADHASIVKRAREFGKTVLAPGAAIPSLEPESSLTTKLDPSRHGWRAWVRSRIGRHLSGRLESLLLEIFAFAATGWTSDGPRKSWKRLAKCFGRWGLDPYFPVKREDNPAMFAAIGPVLGGYEALDVGALYGSRVHRDITWTVHIFAAIAVLAAIVGKLSETSRYAPVLGVAEFLLLGSIVLLIRWSRRTRLHERWTACRLAAEQLRIAGMCLPLFTAPPALLTKDQAKPPARGSTADAGEDEERPAERDLSDDAVALVKRIVRDGGLPKASREVTSREAVNWLKALVESQVDYHDVNHRKLETVEKRLTGAANLLFFLSLIAVLLEFEPVRHLFEAGGPCDCVPGLVAILPDHKWLLLATGAGPAFGAALHGAETRLGVVHRAELSKSMAEQLHPIRDELRRVEEQLDSASEPPRVWLALQKLALEAAQAMGNENTSWHSLLRRSPDTVP